MSMKKVKEILERANRDQQFRQNLLDKPDETLKEYKLPPELIKKFASLDTKRLDGMRRKMEQRLAKDASVAFADDDFWVESVSD